MTQIGKRVIPPLGNLVKDVNVWEFPQLILWIKFLKQLTSECVSAWHRPICVIDLSTQQREKLDKTGRALTTSRHLHGWGNQGLDTNLVDSYPLLLHGHDGKEE